MSDPDPARGPRPPAKAPAPRGRSPFGALLAAATTHADVAQGLAQAYAALPAPERNALLSAIVGDSRREGVTASSVLAVLLPLERDPALARRIAAELVAGDGAALAPRSQPRALLGGDATQGGAVIVQPLYGDFCEALVLAWEAERGFTVAEHVSLVRADRVTAEAVRLPLGLALAETEVATARTVVQEVTRAHRQRHATLPRAFERFENWAGTSEDEG